MIPRLLAALAGGGAAVVVAPPGAGKTTRVPPALLDFTPGRVVVLEPRRVAARAAARRIAEERGWRVGGEVGYQVRFDRVAGPGTRLLIVTEGILVQRLQADPFLEGVAAVVFDEFHERSLDADLALAMARRVQVEVRPELRLIVMSATLDPGPVAAFLGGCPVIESAGKEHPVEVVYLERPDDRPLPQRVAAGVRRALAATGGDVLAFLPGVGEIRRTAELLAPLAAPAGAGGLAVLPLYGDLPAEEQDRALVARPAPPAAASRAEGRAGEGRAGLGEAGRRVVLATNVAETSVTVEGVTAVVDSGFARVLRYDPATGLDRLELVRIGRASADQRAGRAGRLSPGVCFRLWTEHEQRGLRAREAPEIARVDLARPALQLLAWGERDLAGFGWLEPPDPPAPATRPAVRGTDTARTLSRLGRAEELLALLGAVDEGGITPLGRAMARLPLHPRLARLLLEGGRLGWPREVALAAALLSERPPWRRRGAEASLPGGARALPDRRRGVVTSRSDLLDRVEALDRGERGAEAETPWGSLDRGAARAVYEVRDRLLEVIERGVEGGTEEAPAARRGGERAPAGRWSERAGPQAASGHAVVLQEALGRALLAAYPDRLARRREPPATAGGARAAGEAVRGVMTGGRGVRLAAESAVTEAELFVCVDLDAGAAGPGGAAAEARVRLASAVEPEWLPERWRTESTEVAFDPVRERVTSRLVTRWRDLVLAEREVPPDPGAAAAVLAAAAAEALDRALPLDDPEVAQWLARLRCLAAWMPELGLPELREEALRDLLPALCQGRRSFDELRRAPLRDVLRGALTHAQRAALEREAPERLTVPSGSRVRLHYEEGKPPVLAARIQELFGWAETPRVAAGRVPVLLHLLAPNGRPQQVTGDLRSFWQTTYPQVRRELAGRYPKHAWPPDPWSARPERRPGSSRRRRG